MYLCCKMCTSPCVHSCCVYCCCLLLCLLQSGSEPEVLTVEAPGGYPFKITGRDNEGKGAWQ